MKTLLISHASLFTKQGLIEDGSLYVEDGIIKDVGKGRVFNGQPEIEIDAAHHLVTPGLIDYHTHLYQHFLYYTISATSGLEEWLSTFLYPIERLLREEDVFHNTIISCERALRSGVTTVVCLETPQHLKQCIAALESMGIRAVIGRLVADFITESGDDIFENTEIAIERSTFFIKKYSRHPRLRCTFAPRWLPICSRELLSGVANSVRSLERNEDIFALVQTHLNETKEEGELIKKIHGTRAVSLLYSLDLLDHSALAHCIYLSEEENRLIADSQASVVICPTSNLCIVGNLCPAIDLYHKGVHVGIGTDAAPTNLLQELRLLLLNRGKIGDTKYLPFFLDFWEGFQGNFLQMFKIGQLFPDFKADIVIWKPSEEMRYPDVATVGKIGSMVQAQTVIVDGEILLNNGDFVRSFPRPPDQWINKWIKKLNTIITERRNKDQTPRGKPLVKRLQKV